jgi:apolipoprotein D and lipocalin family protein
MKKILLAALIALTGVAAVFSFSANGKPTIPPVDNVDLPRFMGDWYVIAHIPTFIEKDAYDAVESYALRDDGKVQTTYRQRKGSFDAKLETMRPVGTIRPDTGNAVWGMQFVWPIRADYRIAYLSPDYRTTVIAREKRDYLWIMARTPKVDDAELQRLVQFAVAQGYDAARIQRVPQRWDTTAPATAKEPS